MISLPLSQTKFQANHPLMLRLSTQKQILPKSMTLLHQQGKIQKSQKVSKKAVSTLKCTVACMGTKITSNNQRKTSDINASLGLLALSVLPHSSEIQQGSIITLKDAKIGTRLADAILVIVVFSFMTALTTNQDGSLTRNLKLKSKESK